MYKLLGGYREEIPCYASGGYYFEGEDPIKSLEREISSAIEMGFQAFKMKIGRLSESEEVERVRIARQMLGDTRLLMLDANQAFRNIHEVMSFVRRVESYNIYWLEEPLRVDELEAMARLREACPIPLATGEVEATRWAFWELLDRHAVDVVQPDATACGGITEWMRIVALADVYGASVAPHYHWDIHVHLGCAFPEVVMLEKFLGTHIKNFDLILSEPMRTTPSGTLRVPELPGTGVVFDEEAIRSYLVLENVSRM